MVHCSQDIYPEALAKVKVDTGTAVIPTGCHEFSVEKSMKKIFGAELQHNKNGWSAGIGTI